MQFLKKSLLPLVVLLCVSPTYGQKKIDSLQRIVKSEKASIQKAEAYLQLGETLYVQNIDTLTYFSNQIIKTLDAIGLNNGNKFDYYRLKGEAFNNLGYVEYVKGNDLKAESLYDKALKMKRAVKDADGVQTVENNLALVYSNKGNLVGALDIYFRRLEEANLNNSDEDKLIALNNIGYTYQLQHDYTNALIYYQELLKIKTSKKNKILLGATYNNIGALYKNLEKLDLAMVYFHKALRIRRESKHIDGIATTLTLIANIYIDKGEYSKAMSMLQESLEICRKGNFFFLESNALAAISRIQIINQEIENVQHNLNRLKWLWNETDNMRTGVQYAKTGILISEARGNWNEAYNFLELKLKLEDQLTSQEMVRLSQQRKYEVDYERKKKVEELKYVKKIAEKEKLRALSEEKRFRLIITFVLISIGFSLLVISLILKSRNAKYKRSLIEEELRNNILQKKALTLENEKKSRELTGISLRLTANSQFIHEIDTIINNTKDFEKETVDEMLRNLRQRVKINDRTEREWQEFQRQFEGVHVDFIKRLKTDFPRLTQKEIRICMLTKLNAGSDEIINLLGISKNTIKSSRYRIHQKMRLDKGVKLYSFISSY